VYLSDDPTDVTGCLEFALKAVVEADEAERKLKAAKRTMPYGLDYQTWLQQLTADKVITSEDAALLLTASIATKRVIDVDDFANEMKQGATA
jgi:hypothetical protein